jgi:hypothetical protein
MIVPGNMHPLYSKRPELLIFLGSMVCVYYYHRFTRGIGITEPILLWDMTHHCYTEPSILGGNETVVF